MKKILVIFTCFIMNITWAQDDITTIYMIRHAEQAEGEDPGLSEEGKERIQKWGDYFQDKNISTYYSTKYKRTTLTATMIGSYTAKPGEPGTTSKLFTIKGYGGPEDLLLKQVAEDHKGENVVIVGHSNTIPKQINTLLESDKFNTINEDEYGNLYIIKIKDGKASLETLHM